LLLQIWFWFQRVRVVVWWRSLASYGVTCVSDFIGFYSGAFLAALLVGFWLLGHLVMGDRW
jgi:hypothetical protein